MEPLSSEHTQLILRNNLFFVIRSTGLANSVRYHESATLAALNQSRIAHLPVCSTAVSSSLRRFIFRTNRHRIHPSYLCNNHVFKPYFRIITCIGYLSTYFLIFLYYIFRDNPLNDRSDILRFPESHPNQFIQILIQSFRVHIHLLSNEDTVLLGLLQVILIDQ